MNNSSTANPTKQNMLQLNIRHYLLISSFILILPVFLYWQTAWSMVEIWWRSETFAHGFLILPISLYLVWKKREELSQQPIKSNYWGLMLLVLCGLFWFVANSVDIAVIQQLMLISMIPVLVWILFGWSITERFYFHSAFWFLWCPSVSVWFQY